MVESLVVWVTGDLVFGFVIDGRNEGRGTVLGAVLTTNVGSSVGRALISTGDSVGEETNGAFVGGMSVVDGHDLGGCGIFTKGQVKLTRLVQTRLSV